MRLLFTILISCQLLFPVGAQLDLVSRQLTTNDGLPSNTVYDILQASDGALLIATNEGLCRYNGLNFNQYVNPSGSVGLTQIIEYQEGKFITRSFSDNAYVTTPEQSLEELPLLRDKVSYSIFSDTLGTVYRFSKTVLVSVYKDGAFKLDTILSKSSGGAINYCRVIHDTLHVLSATSLIRFPIANLHKKQVLTWNESPNSVLIETPHRTLLFSPLEGTVRPINKEKLGGAIRLANYDPSDKYAHHIVLSDGKLIIATWGGLYVYSKDFSFIGKYLTDYQVSALREDRQGNLLVGTQQDGVFIIPCLEVKSIAKSFLYDRKLKISTSTPVGDALIALGSYNGRVIFMNDSGEFVREINLGVKSEVQTMEYLPEQNKLLAHCFYLFEIDVRTGKIIKKSESTSIKDMIPVGKDSLIAGSSNGISMYVRGACLGILHNELWVIEMCNYRNGVLLNTKHGLKWYNPNTRLLEGVTINDGRKVKKISSDQKGGAFLLIGNDLLHLSSRGTVKKYNGVSSGNSKSILVRKGLVWILSDEGVYTFNVRTKQTKWLISRKESEVSFANALHFMGDHLVLVGINDVRLFDSIPTRKQGSPRLRIKKTLGTFSMIDGEYCSDYQSNRLELWFEQLPNIEGKRGATIRYQILNLEGGNGWKSVTSGNAILLERLPFGNYVLQIVGHDEIGNSSNLLNIRLHIRKPFYATLWFFLLCFLGLGALLYFIQKRREAVLTKKNLQKLSVERLKNSALNSELKAIRSQMNPHFIFNSINSIQTQILSHDSYRAYESLSDFATLLRQALEYTSKEFISLEDELNFLSNYIKLELVRTNHGFHFELSVPNDFRIKSAQIPSLITQPFVENAIRHGLIHKEGDKNLTVQVIGGSENYTIRIKDNGVGRKRSEEINKQNRKDHTSFASKAIAERIEMINAFGKMQITLDIQDLAQGTLVELKIKQR